MPDNLLGFCWTIMQTLGPRLSGMRQLRILQREGWTLTVWRCCNKPGKGKIASSSWIQKQKKTRKPGRNQEFTQWTCWLSTTYLQHNPIFYHTIEKQVQSPCLTEGQAWCLPKLYWPEFTDRFSQTRLQTDFRVISSLKILLVVQKKYFKAVVTAEINDIPKL